MRIDVSISPAPEAWSPQTFEEAEPQYISHPTPLPIRALRIIIIVLGESTTTIRGTLLDITAKSLGI